MSDSPLPYTKWLFLPYVVCHRKGAATAAVRLSSLPPPLSFSLSLTLSADVVGYPNFTPEGQYLLITLEGIVPCTFSFHAFYIPVFPRKKRRKKTQPHRSSMTSPRRQQLFLLRAIPLFAREGWFCATPRAR